MNTSTANLIITNLLIACTLGMIMFTVSVRAEADKIRRAIQDLDNDVITKDIRAILDSTTELLGLEKSLIEEMLDTGEFKCSQIVLIQLLAQKTRQSPHEIWDHQQGQDFVAKLIYLGMSAEQVVEQLEMAYANIAFALMDLPARKRSMRRVVVFDGL